MIIAYKFIKTDHSKLHDFVISYFLKIEKDTKGFRDELFEDKFLKIVNGHPKILKAKFKKIYNYFKKLGDGDKHIFCKKILKSNQIESICKGKAKPVKIERNATGLNKTIRELFFVLYNQVLNGKAFCESIGANMQDHFKQISDANKNITICPFCGISQLIKSNDEFRDQYDHYLPKSLYPFSAINFENLVPCCSECNSSHAKGHKDIIAGSKRKVFFPYDRNHKRINLTVRIRQDNSDLSEIEWQFSFNNLDNKINEIESWKEIYNIETRYKTYIRGRIKSWFLSYYKSVYGNKNNKAEMKKAYFRILENEEKEGLDFIKYKTMKALIKESNFEKAFFEAKKYSLKN